MADSFPYRDEFRHQHSDFVPCPLEPGVVTEAQAIDAAGFERMKMQYSTMRVDTWFGDFEADYPLPFTPSNIKVRIWLVRFWNFEIFTPGRGGASIVSTEHYSLVDARTGYLLRTFSFR